MRFFPILLLALSACGPTIQSGSFMLKKHDAERSFDAITNRASFELHCPREQLKLVTLNVSRDVFPGDWPRQVGVEGCGQRAVYVRDGIADWIMNTERTEAREAPVSADRSGGGRG